MKIKIATRLSPLAMLQTNEVVKKIKFHDSECTCEIIKIKSDGDLTNKNVWDEKINWMNKIQDLYVSSIQEII